MNFIYLLIYMMSIMSFFSLFTTPVERWCMTPYGNMLRFGSCLVLMSLLMLSTVVFLGKFLEESNIIYWIMGI